MAARVHMPLKVIAFDANVSVSSVTAVRLTYRCDSAFRDSSQTTGEVV
jgi:hypothetical protein